MTLREYLSVLSSRGELREVAEPISTRFEVSAALSLLDGIAALRFDDVDDSAIPIIGNVFTSRARIAESLGVTEASLHEHFVSALQRRRPVRVVDEAPWQEVHVEQPNLTAELPVPWFFELESAPYLTAGVVVCRDPSSGRANLSIARMKMLGGHRAMAGIAPNHHLAAFARSAAELGRPLEVAVCLGVSPAVLFASCLYLARGEDELEYAGALAPRNDPVAVVDVTGSGLLIPADCEIVLTGKLDPATLIEEGPVSEFHGMYENYGSGLLVEFAAMYRRRDAFLQVIEPGLHLEHILLGAVSIEAGLTQLLRRMIPAVRAVLVTTAGAGRLEARVALGQHRVGEAKRVISAVWGAVSLIKNVVVVDADVDLDDTEAVNRAIVFNARADRDLVIMADGPADRAEPLEAHGSISRLGIDATRNPRDRDWLRAQPPADVTDRISRILGLGPVDKDPGR